MRKYKLNTEKKSVEPTQEQIRRYKDFQTISTRYDRLTKRSKKPLYRDPKMFLLLVLLGVIMLLLFLE